MNNCACKSNDAYDCFALRYDMDFHSTHQEVENEGGPCECACHEDDEDTDDWTYVWDKKG